VTAGSNFNVKPYADIGDPLPSIGARVTCLLDGATIEGVVSATSPSARTIVFDGFIARLPVTVGGAVLSWTYSTFAGFSAPWQNYATTTTVSSNYWFSRVGS
jgi:hypothetical protein